MGEEGEVDGREGDVSREGGAEALEEAGEAFLAHQLQRQASGGRRLRGRRRGEGASLRRLRSAGAAAAHWGERNGGEDEERSAVDYKSRNDNRVKLI